MKYINYLIWFLLIKNINCKYNKCIDIKSCNFYSIKEKFNNDIMTTSYYKNYNNTYFNEYVKSMLNVYNYNIFNTTIKDDLYYSTNWDSYNGTVEPKVAENCFYRAKNKIIKSSTHINPKTNTTPYSINYNCHTNAIFIWASDFNKY